MVVSVLLRSKLGHSQITVLKIGNRYNNVENSLYEPLVGGMKTMTINDL